jgi:hypothetical protein
MPDDFSINKLLRYFYPILFLIPLNFFIIADGLGSGIQWPFIRYQTTFMGESVIPITSSLDYVLSGTLTGISALYELSPLISSVILFIAFVYAISNLTRISGALTFFAGIVSLSASVMQYGITLHGASGACIPFGSVILLIYGAILYFSVPEVSDENPLRKLDYIFSQFGIKDNNLKKITIIAIVFKLTFFLVMILAYFVLPFDVARHDSVFVYPAGEEVNIFSIFKTWDGQHYLYLAENGYPAGVTTNTAFYPLYPFLVRSVGFILFGNTLVAGLLISNLCSILAVIFFYLFVEKLYNDKIAFTASVFMISFITFFYTSLVYTEGLFILLVIAFFYYLYENKFYPCLLLSILIPLTRPTGILVMLPLFVFLVLKIRNEKGVKETKNWFLLLGFIAGFLIYLCVVNYFTGSFFSGFYAQNRFVSQNSVMNLFDPVSWVQKNFIDIQYTVNGYTTGILDRIVFGFYLVFLYYIYKYLDTTLFVFSLALGLIPALTGDLMSYMRYILVIFPIFIILSLKFQKTPYVIIIPFIVVQVLLLIAHTLNYWVA